MGALAAASGLGGDPATDLARFLARRYGAGVTLLLGSGTGALRVALRTAMGMTGTRTVALPAYTCYDVATAALGAGAEPVLYDVEPGTLGPDWDSLEAALRAGAGILVVSPLFGIPVAWDRLEAAAERHGAVVVEDAAQGHGARWRGRRLGSLAPLSVLSFARGKGWTGGSGGAVLARGAGAERSLEEAGDGVSPRRPESETCLGAASQWGLGRPHLYRLPTLVPWLGLGETRYREPRAPRGMSRSAAALLLSTRGAADREAERRRRRGGWFRRHLPRTPGVREVTPPPESEPGYLRFPVRLSGGHRGFANPDAVRRFGIFPSYPRILAELPPVARRLRRRGRWPGARELAREVVTLPTHSRVGEEDETAILALLEGYRA